MLDMPCLLKLEEDLKSGAMEDAFLYSPEERRMEILEFLEKLMDVAELADEVATRLIFRGSQLGALAGVPPSSTGTPS